MIQFENPSDCCGCASCEAVCPVGCIVMVKDGEGFSYPKVTTDKCIGCHRCEKVCPVLSIRKQDIGTAPQENASSKAYAARGGQCSGSSSGGIFPHLAETVIRKGGVVYGAAFNSDLQLWHCEATTMEQVMPMRGSKYVQSDLLDTFNEIRSHLEASRPVLFTGTPCQSAALEAFLGKDYELLYNVDCACHGVPSPELLERYLQSIAKKYSSGVKKVDFRDKSHGWRHYRVVYTLENGRIISRPKDDDDYMLLFLQNVSLRPSCYCCPFRKKHCSDLTLSDLWNVSKASPALDDDWGASGILVHSEKGKALLEECRQEMFLDEIPVGLAVEQNGGLGGDIPVPAQREAFMKEFMLKRDLDSFVRNYVRRPFALSKTIAWMKRCAAKVYSKMDRNVK